MANLHNILNVDNITSKDQYGGSKLELNMKAAYVASDRETKEANLANFKDNSNDSSNSVGEIAAKPSPQIDSKMYPSQDKPEVDPASQVSKKMSLIDDINEFIPESKAQEEQFAYDEALQNNFLSFEANRSDILSVDNRLEWRSDVTTEDSNDSFSQEETLDWIDTWIENRSEVDHTKDGFAHRADWDSVPDTLSAAFSAEWYSDDVNDRDSEHSDFVNEQVDDILGDNPADFGYTVGFGDNYANSVDSAPIDESSRDNEHILYGAVVGGSDEVNDFSHHNVQNYWDANEVGTSYNTSFAGAAIQQYDNLGSDPLSEFELDQLIGIDPEGVGL